MNQKDATCSSCHCDVRRLIHNIWYENKVQRLCTSCVLFTCKEFFCPTCFGVHGLISKGKLVLCERCNSYSHPNCFSSNPSSSMCLACIDPKRLIFAPRELRKEGNLICKGVDLNGSRLLVTATKVGCMLMCGAREEKQYCSLLEVAETAGDCKKAKTGVIRAMRDQDLKNKDRNVESYFDFPNSEDDSSSETFIDGGRMQKLTIHGQVSA